MGFTHGEDRINPSGYGFADASAALSHAGTVAGGVLLTFGADQILLQGLALAQLTAGDLIL